MPPRPPPWRNPRKGRDPILPSANLDYFTEYDPDGEEDDEGPPPAEAGAAPVGERPHDGREEEPDERGEAPDHRHVLVANT